MNGAFNQVVVRLSPGADERDTIAAMDLLLARNAAWARMAAWTSSRTVSCTRNSASSPP
jgi:hypothetical protein